MLQLLGHHKGRVLGACLQLAKDQINIGLLMWLLCEVDNVL